MVKFLPLSCTYIERRNNTSLSERMYESVNKGLKISVSKTPRTDGTLACRKVTLREKLLARFLGPPRKMMVLVPGDGVDTISITEIEKGDEDNESD